MNDPTPGPWEVANVQPANEPMWIRAGDTTLFLRHSATDADMHIAGAGRAMLEALEGLVAARSIEDLEDAWDVAHDAIAKARGPDRDYAKVKKIMDNLAAYRRGALGGMDPDDPLGAA